MRKPLLGAVAAPFVFSSCAPSAASASGDRVGSLYDLFMYIAAAIFVVVAGLILSSILRFRDKEPAGRIEDGADLPPQFHTNLKLEILWFAIPTAIVVFLFASSIGVLGEVNEEKEDALVVDVTAFQWGWRFEYAGTTVESLPGAPATVVLPAGVPIAFELNSPDVIHNFYVPRFLIKRDVIPGQTNRLDVTIEEEGTYRGACAEFCGLFHGEMDFDIEVVSEDAWDDWVDNEGGEG
jgi:cytochrome c oxidase subunit 2